MTGPVERLQIELRAVRAVCAERERELLELKGPCRNSTCRLHYAHAGPCDIPEARQSIGSQADFDKFAHADAGSPRGHGWTYHGHGCCSLAPDPPPVLVARCGGPALCAKCAQEIAQLHQRSTDG